MTRNLSLALMFSVALALFTATDACAGTLVIKGQSEMTVSLLPDGKVHLAGAYRISNSGNETANGVSPQFELGAWSWVGEPRPLEANKETSWDINLDIPQDKLKCSPGDRCAGLDLPPNGLYPLLITRHYQDLNGYRFSSTEVLPLVIGVPDESTASQLRIPKIEGKLEIEGDGKVFTLGGEVMNLSQTDAQLALSFFTSRELRVMTPAELLNVPANKVVPFTAKLENFTGLPGSSYAVHAVAQWRDGDLRNSVSFSRVAQVTKPSETKGYIAALLAVVAVLVISLYLAVFGRGERRTEPAGRHPR